MERNKYGRKDQPWLVHCSLCQGGGDFFADPFAFLRPIGWAPTWRIAQDFAHRHAVEHEKTRCPTCLHLPAERLPQRATT